MIVVQTYKQNVEGFSGITSAVTFESLKKRLRLYFKNIGKCKAMLYSGEIIDIPYVVLQKDRRIRDIRIENERRKKTSWLR